MTTTHRAYVVTSTLPGSTYAVHIRGQDLKYSATYKVTDSEGVTQALRTEIQDQHGGAGSYELVPVTPADIRNVPGLVGVWEYRPSN